MLHNNNPSYNPGNHHQDRWDEMNHMTGCSQKRNVICIPTQLMPFACSLFSWSK